MKTLALFKSKSISTKIVPLTAKQYQNDALGNNNELNYNELQFNFYNSSPQLTINEDEEIKQQLQLKKYIYFEEDKDDYEFHNYETVDEKDDGYGYDNDNSDDFDNHNLDICIEKEEGLGESKYVCNIKRNKTFTEGVYVYFQEDVMGYEYNNYTCG
eukprot:Pgem_evm1s2947